MSEYVDFQNALALAIASGIGGDGEMMVQETLWEGSASQDQIVELSKSILFYDIISVIFENSTIYAEVKNIPYSSAIGKHIPETAWSWTSNSIINLRILYTDDKHIQNAIVQVGFNDLVMTKVTGIKFTGTKSIDYSTEEQVIGKWIDGKPLYQKTYFIPTLPSKSTLTVPLNISNISTVFIKDGYYSNGSVTVPYSTAATGPSPSLNYFLSQYNTFIQDNSILITTGADRSTYHGYITIQYTKTTD